MDRSTSFLYMNRILTLLKLAGKDREPSYFEAALAGGTAICGEKLQSLVLVPGFGEFAQKTDCFAHVPLQDMLTTLSIANITGD